MLQTENLLTAGNSEHERAITCDETHRRGEKREKESERGLEKYNRE